MWTESPNDNDTNLVPAIPYVSAGDTPPNLDLIQGTITSDLATSTLKVRVYVKGMSLTLPQGADKIVWATGWAINTMQEQVAYAAVHSSGHVSYFDGIARGCNLRVRYQR